MTKVVPSLFFVAALTTCDTACDAEIQAGAEPKLPVAPEVFISQFQGAEGITFNGEGRLFLGANNQIWIAEPNGGVTRIAEVDRHLGQAGIGTRDILAADFGPTNIFEHGANDDGVVWRITPEGRKTPLVKGIADPNAVLVLRDGSLLITDDGTDKIYRFRDGVLSVWSTAVPYPNGIALSLDERTLFVAQVFSALKPVVFDDRVWAIRTENGDPVGAPTLAARTGKGGVDGLVTDELGRIYIADNGAGAIVRLDPATQALTVIAEGMTGIASLVFGEGAFDRKAIYATSTRRGGGKIWKIPVGVGGARVHR